MTEKGFTLIELLAVIVILAIIALIAVPIILNIINSSKESSDKRSIEAYGKSVELALYNYELEENKDKIKTLKDLEPYIKYNGNKVECDITNINKDGEVYLADCKVENKEVEYTYGEEPIIMAATDKTKTKAGTIPQGNFNLGDEYVINVDGNHKYHFYILSTEEDKVNLIMSNNICSDGTLATTLNKCLTFWNEQNNSTKGPVTAMSYLYEATKNWSNIPNIQIHYIDEGDKYTKIITNEDITNIISKDGTVTASYINLKSRLPKYSEVLGTGCTEDKGGSCPVWMVNGLTYASQYSGAKKDHIDGIYAYWILSSYVSYSYTARDIYCIGTISNYNANGEYGIRPVITVSKSDLS